MKKYVKKEIIMKKYVKLVSDGTWFVEGSEVWHYDKFERISLDEFEEWNKVGIVNCRGIRYDNISGEHIDGETCNLDEFLTIITDFPKPFYPESVK